MKTSEILRNSLEQLHPNLSAESTKILYSEIELTEEETAEALRQGREDKFYRLQREAYSAKISAPTEWLIPTARELYEGLRATKSKLSKPYKVTNDNRAVIEILCLYFSNSEKLVELFPNIDPKKGICITGNKGVGKSHLMNFFGMNPKARYMIPTCKDVAEKFRNKWEYEGQNTIEYYSSSPKAKLPSRFDHETLGFCFGDLGTEEVKNDYGNKMNVIEEIFFNRYESGVPFYMTHFTTNLNGDEIMERYGVRFHDRLKESMNWLVLKGESFR